MSTTASQLRNIVYSSLMAALIAAGGIIAIPLGPVPITLQSLFILLAGLLLGMKWGSACVGIYLLAGGMGLPVFAAGKGGFAVFASPTGGYLLGFLVAVFLIGVITDIADKKSEMSGSKRFVVDLIAVLIGSTAVYALGVPWLKTITGMPWQKAFAVGALPFLPGDAIKMTAAVIIARTVRPAFGRSNVAADQTAN